MNKLIFFIACLSLVTLSCETAPTSQELIDTRKADAEKKFEQFYACYEIAKTAPKLTEDKINWSTNDASVSYGESNVYQIGLESFKDLSEPLDVILDGTRRREHVDMAKLFNIDLSEHKEPHAYNSDFKYAYNSHDEPGETVCSNAIHHFLNAKYLLINRITERMAPLIISEDEYIQGFAIGDVLVFDLEKQALLGGFIIEERSKDSYSLKEYSDPTSNLLSDLEMSVYGTIKSKFQDLTPSLAETRGFEF